MKRSIGGASIAAIAVAASLGFMVLNYFGGTLGRGI